MSRPVSFPMANLRRCSMETGAGSSSPVSLSGKLHFACFPRMLRAAASYARAASSAVSKVPSHLHPDVTQRLSMKGLQRVVVRKEGLHAIGRLFVLMPGLSWLLAEHVAGKAMP